MTTGKTKSDMVKLADAFSAMPAYKRVGMPNDQVRLLQAWELAGDLSLGFREYPTMELPTEEEIDTLYVDDLTQARMAVDVLCQKYRSGWDHSAAIAGVALRLGIHR